MHIYTDAYICVYTHVCTDMHIYTQRERGREGKRETERRERWGAACRMSPRAGSSYCPYLGSLQCARECLQPLLSVCHLSVTATKLVSN